MAARNVSLSQGPKLSILPRKSASPCGAPSVFGGALSVCPREYQRTLRAPPLRAADTSATGTSSQASSQKAGGLATDGRSDAAGLVAWAAAKGIESPSMMMADFMGLRGMKATKAIEVDDALVTLPKEAALLVIPRMACPFPDMCSPEMWKSSPWWFKMSLLLLEERRKGSESRLSGYVEQLPRTIDTTLHWSDAELKELQYPALVEAVQKQRADWADIHRRLVEGAPGTPITQDDLYWAIENVRSRVFSGPYTGGNFKSRARLGIFIIGLAVAAVSSGKVIIEDALNGLIAAFGFNIIYDLLLSQQLKWYAMCPVIDFMNHDSNVESDVSWEYFGDRFVARAMKPWKEGEQVFINYGVQSNDSLLQYYGFVEEDNPNDCYVINDFGSLLDACSPEPGKGPELWQKANISAKLSEVKITRQGVPAVALVAARLVMMPQSLIKDKGLEAANAELPAKEEEAALQLVNAALQSVLDGSGTTLQEDEKRLKKLQRDDLAYRSILAVQFRVQKKRLLEEQCRRLVKKAGRTSTKN